MDGLFDFLEEPQLNLHVEGSSVDDHKIGKQIQLLNEDHNDWETADIILLGCGATYGATKEVSEWNSGPDAIREALYQMYDWHPSIKVADLGNVIQGATPSDTRAALRTVLKEIEAAGKIAVLIGGSHDLMLQQYEVFEQAESTIEIANVDRFIDLDDSEGLSEYNFLMQLLTRQPNFVNHYSQLGFQSYDVHPNVLETLDKLSFDCCRLGRLRESLEEMEPVFRHCNLIGIDLQVLRYAEAPFLKDASPNGLFGDELCQLARYAGMSSRLSSLGIFGYYPDRDPQKTGAKLVAQMLWYFVDGYRMRKQEASLRDMDNFVSYYVPISGVDTLFLKSKRTGRWWMQLPDLTFVPCSYKDYLTAGSNEIPDRWLAVQGRIV